MVNNLSDAKKVRDWIDGQVRRSRTKTKTVTFTAREIADKLGISQKNVSAALCALRTRHNSIDFDHVKPNGGRGRGIAVYSASPDTICYHDHVAARRKPRRVSATSGDNISHLLKEAVDVLARVQEVLSHHG